MKIDIYTSIQNGGKYLSVLKGTKVEELKLPEDIDPEVLTLSPLRTRLELDANKEHNTLDPVDIIEQIESKGYAVHGTKTQISLTSK